MAICKGCGAVLQSDDPRKPGYTPKEGAEYCQRCFRLMHYDDLTVSMREGIDPDGVMKKIAESSCLVVWVVDLFDFEAGMIPGIGRKLGGKDIILAATKRDLLPVTMSEEKIAKFVFTRLKDQGISIRHLVLCDMHDENSVEALKDAIEKYRDGREVMVMGRANAGKSTLLNRLMHNKTLTMSRYPGTTLDFNPMVIDGIPFTDTPGIEIEGSMLMKVKEKDLKTIMPAHTIKPQIYQIHGEQSFLLGGLARVDLIHAQKASAVFYVSERLNLHRCRTDKAEALYKAHAGELFTPVPEEKCFQTLSCHMMQGKMDAVIDGLGWVCVSGDVEAVQVHVPKGVHVTFRKAMI
ncbi:MAG: ribosome biogenesis GTPase YqeH [Solobacterium sp.]|jgi:ribosome biogenesis GTPase YqeH|nr:ribosome biogenesis GTPase YqeH [Solobacterium sp.]MCH4047931.1 ribosome biogenesis GTPase YqeH [Solobacterium sp.]MCH4075483.1 ribosome biogenesis GTPase YqeH [Solobacterium sp.]MCI1313650.1 ribosome biogenesis GTPase YqeH [Solobacterium sp.]MCI1346219.1 ribosome biogenesis GTPase YqeH [Solobacterium sp.]